MKPLAFNLRGAKKVAGDNKSSTFQLGSGHQIRVSHAALPLEQRKSIQSMPLHADEGADVGNNQTPPMDRPGDDDPTTSDIASLPPDTVTAKPGNTVLNPGADGLPTTVDTVVPADSFPAPASTAPPTEAPAPVEPAPAPKTGVSAAMPNISPEGIYATGMAGVAAEQQAATQRAQGELAANKAQEAWLGQHQQAFEQGLQSKTKEIDATLADIKKGHINPNSYMQNMQTPQKVATAIGLFLGGWGSAYTGQGNPAMEFLNKQIDRDIESQKANLDNKKTLLGAYFDQTKNMYAAENMARATQAAIYANKFQDAALSAATPAAKAAALKGAAAFQQQIFPLVRASQWAQTQAKLMADNGGNNIDSQVQGAMMQARMNGDQEGYKDLQTKYLPGVGLAKIPLTPENRTDIVNLTSLTHNLGHAIELQSKYRNGGAWSVDDRADANHAKEALSVSLNELYNLKRLNDHEYNSYKNQIGQIGSVNAGGTLRGLTDIYKSLQDRKSTVFGSVGLPVSHKLPGAR